MARQRKKGNPIVTAVIFGIFGIVLLFLGYVLLSVYTAHCSM